MRYILLLCMVVGLAGCSLSADMISTSDELGGKQDGPRWGVIRYDADATFAGTQKEDARRKMERYCAPLRHRVIETGQKQSYSSSSWKGTGGGSSSTIVFVKFQCDGRLSEEQRAAYQKQQRLKKEKKIRDAGICHPDHPEYDPQVC